MTCANAGTVVAVKVFVEGNEIAPVGIDLKFFDRAENRPATIRVFQEDP
jgi:hypothetical protein